jgi:hypothetical protein
MRWSEVSPDTTHDWFSDKTVAAGKIEVKGRKENEAKMVERSEILNFLNNTKNTL